MSQPSPSPAVLLSSDRRPDAVREIGVGSVLSNPIDRRTGAGEVGGVGLRVAPRAAAAAPGTSGSRKSVLTSGSASATAAASASAAASAPPVPVVVTALADDDAASPTATSRGV